MKRIPELLKKVKQNALPARQHTIGILGISSGIGVTHTCIMLANCIGGMKRERTALLEMNQSQDFIYLQRAYEGEQSLIGTERFFTIFGICYYSKVKKEEVVSILNLDYDCFIFDFGNERKENFTEFLRCSEKIIICNLTEWKIHELIQFLKEVKQVVGYQSWNYIAVLGDKSSARDLEKKFGISILCMETEENPFSLSKNTLKVLQDGICHRFVRSKIRKTWG